jgi:hypothetical protein
VQAPVDNFNPTTNRALLAHTIAEAFQDKAQLSRYLICVKKYPLALVYRAFAEAKAVPEYQIKKSRSAIFFYLVRKHAHESS